jgi:hypothetical protein
MKVHTVVSPHLLQRAAGLKELQPAVQRYLDALFTAELRVETHAARAQHLLDQTTSMQPFLSAKDLLTPVAVPSSESSFAE